MGRSSVTGIDSADEEPAGRDVELLGPSDSSDSGSDSVGNPESDAATDSEGTGERRSADHDPRPRDAEDIGVDRVFSVDADADADIERDPDAAPRSDDEEEDPDLAFVDRARAGDVLDDEAPAGDDAPLSAPAPGESP